MTDWSAAGHDKNDTRCIACSQGGPDYPHPCACGGLLHASWASDDRINAVPDGLPLDLECDRCGQQSERIVTR